MKTILNIKSLSTYLGVSTSTIYKWTSNKEIPHFKPTGKRIFFNKEEIDQWILSSRVTTIAEDTASTILNLKTRMI